MALLHTCLISFFGLCLVLAGPPGGGTVGAEAPHEPEAAPAACAAPVLPADIASQPSPAPLDHQDQGAEQTEVQNDPAAEDEGSGNSSRQAADDQADQAAEEAEAETQRPASPPPPDDVDPRIVELLDRIEATMKTIETVQTRFRWDAVQVLVGDEQQFFGTLSYIAETPARFHAHVDVSFIDERRGEEDRQLIFDGSWLIDRNEKEKLFVKRQVVAPDAPEAERDPLGLGTGPFPVPLDARRDRILERFTVVARPPMEEIEDEQLIPAIRTRLEKSVRLQLEPREGVRMDIERIDLWYDRETLLPQRIQTADDRGNLTIFHLFIDPQKHINVEIDEALFDVEPPRERGWEVQVEPLEPQRGR